jgi:hypothetical protein
MLQQISYLVFSLKMCIILMADFNFSPDLLEQTGWCSLHHATIRAPSVTSTNKGSSQILDHVVMSTNLVPVTSDVADVPIPCGTHCGLEFSIRTKPTDVMVRRLVEPKPLPMQLFHEKWNKLHVSLQNSFFRSAAYRAHHMLASHSRSNFAPAILGFPTNVLVQDSKFLPNISQHVMTGELLAQAALQLELVVCSVLGLPEKWYIGRSQYPHFEEKPALPNAKNNNNMSPSLPTFGDVFPRLSIVT